MNYTNNKSNWFYPITPYHLLVSITIRNTLYINNYNNIVIDLNLFDEKILNSIKLKNNWNEILILPKSCNFFRKIQAKYFNKKMFNLINNSNIFIFTPGNSMCNSIINLINKKNNQIILADDGIAPYYFDNIQEGWEKYLYKKNSINYFLTKLFFDESIFRFSKNLKYLLLNQNISQLENKDIIYLKIQDFEINNSLNEFSFYFSKCNTKINNKINIVVFYNNSFLSDKLIFSFVKDNFNKFNVLHKFRRDVTKKHLIKLGFNNSLKEILEIATIPWEIIYHDNFKFFNQTLLLFFSFSTSIIDTFLKYKSDVVIILIQDELDINFKKIIFNLKNKIIVFRNLDEFKKNYLKN